MKAENQLGQLIYYRFSIKTIFYKNHQPTYENLELSKDQLIII